ncbi:MAG TPA: MMPL family transporter [Solirubrobacteraceae bacterium]|nr:MMPL family transporter [Solirubrobacteraceae bacterium]
MIERLARLANERPRRVLALAGLLVAIAVVVGGPVVGILKSQSSDFLDPNAPNQQVLRDVERATGQSAAYGVAALVASSGDVRTDAAAQARASRVAGLLSREPGFQRSLTYPASHLRVLVSRDGHQTLVLAAFANRERSVAAVAAVRRELAGEGVRFGGNDVAFDEINKRTTSDLGRAEMLAFPLLLLLSFWIFRGLVAAVLPLLVGGCAILITFLALRLIDQGIGLSIFAVNLVTGVGLGLAIDYSLFVLSRYREELAGGHDTPEAIARTLRTAGRTVLYSSLTVAGALASMLVFPLRFLYSMGIGGSLVALAAGAVSLIVLPAVLVVLGPRIDALSPARLQRNAARAARPDESGAWFRLARAVMRRPGAVALGTALVLIAIALPALRLSLTPADAHVLPASAEPRQVAEAITRDFAVDGSQTITLVTHAPASAAARLAGLARAARARAGRQASLAGAPRYLGRDTWELEMLPRGRDGAPANQALVRRLGTLPGPVAGPHASPARVLVGGATAWFVDQKAAIAAHAPLALVILALVTGSFLFMMTGSLVLPLVAFAMNLLTVAVGAGLLVLIFQRGHLASPLGFTPIGGLEESNLVLLFVLAFALSTDYGVFLLGRIKEAHDAGMPTREAVAHGLERTGRLVTAAALLFCVAVGAFVSSEVFFVKQLGAGAALAVLIDATVVRALLVPALMGRLGERCWWAPGPLRSLHARIGLRERELSRAPA